MIEAQRFKATDTLEEKFFQCAKPIFDLMSLQKDLFFDEAYRAFPLGDLIFEDLRSPLSNAIDERVFRESFQDIFESFISAGTFERYIQVFERIFGETVDVQFTVPGPGKLNIAILADELETSDLQVREVINNQYHFFDLVDDEENEILAQTIKGFESQYELERMLFEMVPGGIYTQITLSFI